MSYINGLYTVYTNLFLFDNTGKIIAVSKKSEENLIGKTLTDDYIKNVLSHADSQFYSVSSFNKTDLYNHKNTYVYAASITNISNSNSVVGGVGIVFDSEPQFQAMLSDSLPHLQNGDVVPGYTALFVDRHKKIISTSDTKYAIGSELDLPDEFFQIANGESLSKSVLIGDKYYSIGVSCSSGNREYKGKSDRYKNDVLCISMIYLGEKQDTQSKHINKESRVRVDYGPRASNLEIKEFATFYVNNTWLGFDKSCVVECIKLGKLTPLPGYGKEVEGSLMFNNQPICVVNPSSMIGSDVLFFANQIIVVKSGDNLVGVLVNELGEIPEVPENFIVKQGLLKQNSPNNYIAAIVKPAPNDPESRMLIVLDPHHFFEAVLNGKSLDKSKLSVISAGPQESNGYDEVPFKKASGE